MTDLLRSAVTFFSGLSTGQRIGLVLASVIYIVAGGLHFIKTRAYLKIMPPYAPVLRWGRLPLQLLLGWWLLWCTARH